MSSSENLFIVMDFELFFKITIYLNIVVEEGRTAIS